MKVILASASPRRKELLGMVVPEFEVLVSDVEETLEDGLTPEEQTSRLAYIKAKDVFERTVGDRVVIGSDTIVTKNGRIYGKPKDREDAKRMLCELLEGDRTHSVITGLCVMSERGGKVEEHTTFDEVKVFLKEMSEEEMDKWIDTGKAMDKAGAYGIQNEFGVFVEKIDGNYTTVVGLPIHRVYDLVKGLI
ncbi:MAG: septum formation protein Maf [Clostridia bacterium]|nr:septum formation protein Maf [Clostridia bacterium]